MDFVRRWSEKTEISVGRFIAWLGVTVSKFYNWRERYGRVNEHNGWVPRNFWLEPWEKEAIIGFHLKNPLEGYRRLTFMMLDADVVAVSPASVWREHRDNAFPQAIVRLDNQYFFAPGFIHEAPSCEMVSDLLRIHISFIVTERLMDASGRFCNSKEGLPNACSPAVAERTSTMT